MNFFKILLCLLVVFASGCASSTEDSDSSNVEQGEGAAVQKTLPGKKSSWMGTPKKRYNF